jgi:hypothetical protein
VIRAPKTRKRNNGGYTDRSRENFVTDTKRCMRAVVGNDDARRRVALTQVRDRFSPLLFVSFFLPTAHASSDSETFLTNERRDSACVCGARRDRESQRWFRSLPSTRRWYINRTRTTCTVLSRHDRDERRRASNNRSYVAYVPVSALIRILLPCALSPTLKRSVRTTAV